jgi:hypothetical protein
MDTVEGLSFRDRAATLLIACATQGDVRCFIRRSGALLAQSLYGRWGKRAADIVLGGILSIVALPVVVLLAHGLGDCVSSVADLCPTPRRPRRTRLSLPKLRTLSDTTRLTWIKVILERLLIFGRGHLNGGHGVRRSTSTERAVPDSPDAAEGSNPDVARSNEEDRWTVTRASS